MRSFVCPTRSLWPLRVILAATALVALPARADAPRLAAHPIFGMLPDLPGQDGALTAFKAATARLRVGAVEVMDVTRGPSPKLAERLRDGKVALRDMKLVEAEAILSAGASEAASSGAAGIGTADLAELYLNQAWALQRADWKDLTAPPTDLGAEPIRAAFLRAAVLTPDRALLPRQFPPLVSECWRLAVTEVRSRPRGRIIVRGPATATASIDGGPAKPLPVDVPNLVFGEHIVRVDDPGRLVWAQTVPLAQESLDIDVPPQAPLELDDQLAAAQARRQGGAHALIALPRPVLPLKVELRLIDATSGTSIDRTTVTFAGDPGALEAAVIRLDELSRKRVLEQSEVQPMSNDTSARTPLVVATVPTSPPSALESDAKPPLKEDPIAWTSRRWPLVVALGVFVGTGVALTLATSNRDR